MELVRAYVDAGLPKGVINLVFGVPSEISEYLIPHPIVRKISFTGSTAVGKHLAGLAGQHMKRVTMELGGHAPAIVFEDADVDAAAKVLSANKFRNAGQVCVAPTRFLVHEKVYEPFVDKFVAATKKLKVGPGMDASSRMGPLANSRRVDAMESFVNDAVQRGANLRTGGKRIGNEGYFFEPTVMTDVPKDARIMNEEPFGPLAPIASFADFDEVVAGGQSLAIRTRGLCLYPFDPDGGGNRLRGRKRHGVDQPSRSCPSRSAVRRGQGFRLRIGRWRRSDRSLPQHEVCHAGERVNGTADLVVRRRHERLAHREVRSRPKA